MYAKKNSSKKLIAILLAVALLVGGAVGGTVAWLITSTETITNTFAVGDINITLNETTNEGFKIVPGTSQEKNPTVTVEAGSEDCYVFVKIEESNIKVGDVQYVKWEIAEGWTKLEDGVYYQEHTGGNEGKYPVLKNNVVSYPSTLTKANLDALDALTEEPSLKFTAYAVQLASGNNTEFEAADAWAEVNKG